MNPLILAFLGCLSLATFAQEAKQDPWVVYEGSGKGAGQGKHIVLIAGDEEYRSEEACPMLGRILATHHGFKCTVLFSSNPKTGEIDPTNQTHIPGMHLLETADLAIVFLRFRELPDADMKHLDDFLNAGKPVIGLRTSTHAFQFKRNKKSPYAKYSFRNNGQVTSFGDEIWDRGFGGYILGETWVNHHGHHGRESSLGVIAKGKAEHPVVRGGGTIWGPTDVYGVRKLPKDADVIVLGQVLTGMSKDTPAVEGKKNEPMMPLIWARRFKLDNGKECRAICSTIGAASDFVEPGLRRVMVNSCHWLLDLEVPAKAVVELVGTYKPTRFGFGKYVKGTFPKDYRGTGSIPPR